MALDGISGGIIPKRGQSIEDLRTKYNQAGQDIAVIDANNDGKFNYGKEYGDTIKIFDWDNKTATGHHLVKKGEVDVGANAGAIDTTTAPLGRSLKKTFQGLSQKEIQAKYPNSILVNPKGEDKFTPGSTIILTGADGKRHNVHYVADGEVPAQTLKMTGAKDMSEVKSDKGVLSGEMVWKDVTISK